jgi:hypothetical protein
MLCFVAARPDVNLFQPGWYPFVAWVLLTYGALVGGTFLALWAKGRPSRWWGVGALDLWFTHAATLVLSGRVMWRLLGPNPPVFTGWIDAATSLSIMVLLCVGNTLRLVHWFQAQRIRDADVICPVTGVRCPLADS